MFILGGVACSPSVTCEVISLIVAHFHIFGKVKEISSFSFLSLDDSCDLLTFPSLTNRSFSFLILSNKTAAGSSFASCGTNLPLTAKSKINSRNFCTLLGASANKSKCSKNVSNFIQIHPLKLSSIPVLNYCEFHPNHLKDLHILPTFPPHLDVQNQPCADF